MSLNTFGHLFRVTTWGESHGPAIGCTVDGCPPGVALTEGDIQPWLDRRKPGTSKFTTQRKEPDEVRILSGVFEGVTTGTPIQLMIENTDQRSKDYGDIASQFRPGTADMAYRAVCRFSEDRHQAGEMQQQPHHQKPCGGRDAHPSVHTVGRHHQDCAHQGHPCISPVHAPIVLCRLRRIVVEST